MRERLAYDHDGHKGSVEVDCDWGGPCEYKPACSCGWFGTTLGDVLHTDGSGTVGTEYEAFAELLDHMGLTVLDYVEHQDTLMLKALQQIRNLTELVGDQMLINEKMQGLDKAPVV